MTEEEKDKWLRLLKGAPISVLMKLAGAQRGMTAKELQKVTGWSDKPVRNSLDLLESLACAKKLGRRKGWIRTPEGSYLAQELASDEVEKGAAGKKAKSAAWPPPPIPESRPARKNSSTFSGVPIKAPPSSGIDDDLGRPIGNTAGMGSGNSPGSNREHGRTTHSDQNESDHDLIETTHTTQSDLIHSAIRSDQRQAAQTNGGGGSGAEARNDTRSAGERAAVAEFLRRIRIEGKGFKEILARDGLVDVVAWYWYTMGKKIDNPRGWVIRCLDNGDKAPAEYRELARAWLTMDEDDLEAFYQARWGPFGAEDYWQAQGLSQEAIEVYTVTNRHDGLELFEELKRPILNGE